jgi:hypothetical protein
VPVAGCCILRDACDVVPVLCGHYLRMGVDRLLFIDDHSTDGTFERLQAMAHHTSRVSVRRAAAVEFQQETEINRAVAELVGAGYRVILPFDADELWDLDRSRLGRLAGRTDARVLRARLVSFVQTRGVSRSSALSLLHVRHRVDVDEAADAETVGAMREPFVRVPLWKAGIVTDAPRRFLLGQHDVATEEPLEREDGFEIMHVPFRSRHELVKRAVVYEPRRATRRRDPGESWQSRFHAEAVRRGLTDRVWAANSVDRLGRLDVYGRLIPATRDDRLRRAVTTALAHLLWRYGVRGW